MPAGFRHPQAASCFQLTMGRARGRVVGMGKVATVGGLTATAFTIVGLAVPVFFQTGRRRLASD